MLRAYDCGMTRRQVLEAISAVIPMSGMVSAQLGLRAMQRTLERALARTGVDPTRVVIELTEREKVEDVNRLQANLGALRTFGVRVAADDVGAGNAGLRLLSQMRFDIVKIDLSLVQDGTERDTSRAVLRSLRELAGRWQASVIAEGLETVSQLRMVRELGITAGQGYLLARPMAEPDMLSVDLAAIEAGGLVLSRTGPLGERPLSTPAVAPN